MARATHVLKSQKPISEDTCGISGGIPKGSSYYWWKFKRGGKYYSLTPPRRSQLTQSNFYSAIYDLEDDVIGNACADETLPDVRDNVVSALEEVRDTCQDSLDNMPEGLQQGSTGELLQERIDAMESAISEFQDLDLDEFTTSDGVEVDDEHKNADGDCKECGQSERHKADCEHAGDEADHVNDDGLTKDEYWEAKLEEFNGISIEAP